MKINNERYSPVQVNGIISLHATRDNSDVRFVGVFGHPKTDTPMAVFYNPKPDESKGHKNYFGYFTQAGKLYVSDASWADGMLVCGAVHDNQFHYSVFRHDFNQFTDELFIDGGYNGRCIRTNANSFTNFTIKNGEWSMEI